MFSETFDAETGGILLQNIPTGNSSKEWRPVYAEELDILGFDRYFTYDKQNDVPYMWATKNNYYYRAKRVAKVVITDLSEPHRIEIFESISEPLRPVDIDLMVKKNQLLLEELERITIERIQNIFIKYKDRVDIAYVAYSGGKDAQVLLHLVEQALLPEHFIVVFSDTDMEYIDTIETVKKTQEQCKSKFLWARSTYTSEESWNLFGYPARNLRWCCSVHKSVLSNLAIRNYLNKSIVKSLVFVGVRKYESLARSSYEFECESVKIAGQYSYNAILDWTSAEIYLYSYFRSILLNPAYKKGFGRVGCVLCCMSGVKSEYLTNLVYPNAISKYLNIIYNQYNDKNYFNKLIACGNWRARINGRDISRAIKVHYKQEVNNGYLTITIDKLLTDWKEWIKPIGKLTEISDVEYSVLYEGNGYKFSCNGYLVRISEDQIKGSRKNIAFGRLFKYCFRKAACCVGCQLCESQCQLGAITFTNGNVSIDCKHCSRRDCYDVDEGCLRYNSIRLPKGKICCNCGKQDLHNNEIGMNMKLISRKIKVFYCFDCLEEKLGIPKDKLLIAVDTFKEQGCTLFE